MAVIPVREEALRGGTFVLHRLLAGFTNEVHFQQVAGTTLLAMNDDERAEARRLVARAREAAAALPPEGHGDIVVRELKSPHLDRVRATEAFRAHYGPRSVRFALVDAARLCSFQPFVRLAAPAPAPAGEEELIRHALPDTFDNNIEFNFTLQPSGMRILASSPDPNFSLEGVDIVPQRGPLLKFAATKNWIQVARFAGRSWIKNGYHRVFNLLRAGVRQVPAIVFDAVDWNDVAGGDQPGFFSSAWLSKATRAPLMGDFLTEAAVDLPLRQHRKVIEVRISLDTLMVPI